MSIAGEVHPHTALRRTCGEHGADLHLHSIYSDGVHTPNWLVSKAVHAGLDCIALTDHDTVEGCEETAKLCEEAGLGFIPGAELTAYALDEEIHILGLGLDVRNAVFLEKMNTFQEKR
ncbi:MAG: PHP domain-containing protein, partial [Verrucomicrobia bacterium]|nr:PHP domain-containing protein [Verrucomicrobiota bacterium]